MAGELMPVAMTLRRLSPDFSIVARAPGTWTRRMTLRHLAATSLLALALTTGCSPMPHGDPNNPQKNPHPVQRYEVIATADAPGSWDSVNATVFFEVTNLACTPEDKFLGVHTKPRDVALDFEMTRTDERTWKGHFYRDSMLDEDYYGLGVCHWDAIGVTPVFSVHGRTFGAATSFERALARPQAIYFGKGEYLNREPASGGALGFSAVYPEVLKHPETFFPITVSVKEAKP